MLYQWIHHTGNHFENTKILIDTGALIPTGVAISEYFFTNTLRGRMEDLEPSELGSANGASSNSTMETIGQRLELGSIIFQPFFQAQLWF